MVMKRYRLLSIAVLLLLSSCVNINLQQTEPTPNVIVETALPTQEVTNIPAQAAGLTEAVLLNSEYLSPSQGKAIKLVEGKFSGLVDGVELSASIEPGIQFGDLNGDGVDDAALLLAENTGGTGTFVSMIVIFSKDGKFQQAPGVTIDDRPIIDSMVISEGKVQVKGYVHGPNDAMINPTQGVTQEYTLVGENLFLTRLNSAISSGGERAIVIDAPVEGEQVSGSVRVSGSMPIAPFENTLLLQILDANRNELYSSAFIVQAADIGQPATFDNTIPLPAISSGSTVVLLLKELSMADGSPLTISSVIFTIK